MFKSLILFHRRLLVLVAVFIAVLVVLIGQLGRLTISQGEVRFLEARGRLHSTSYLPTWRGRILDRKGNVIAEDVASYDIAIDWDLITGDRAGVLALKDAKQQMGNDSWKSMSKEEQEHEIAQMLPHREIELRHFWSIIAAEVGLNQVQLTKKLDSIREKVEELADVVWAEQEKAHRKQYGEKDEFVERPIREQSEPHVVLPRVSDEVAIQFSLLSDVFDGAIHVKHSRERAYPMRTQVVLLDRSTLPKPMRQFDTLKVSLEHVAERVVGDVREKVWAEDIKRKPFRAPGGVDLQGYRAGDEIGKRGIESSMEEKLRGKRGQIVKHGNGDQMQRLVPIGGKNVRVTLDMELQARVEAVMSHEFGLMMVQPWHDNKDSLEHGTPLRGAVVVLDVATSEVLAMVSTPALQDEHDKGGYPWLNRAAQGYYAPGSIIKPLVLVSAITEGELLHGEEIECVGHYFPHKKNSARCWIYRPPSNKTHGKLKPIEAIARSCNIFFYELGTRLGFTTLLEWLQRFGMSQPLAAQLTESSAVGFEGHLPSEIVIQSLKDRGALKFETVMISIGQGVLTWSPLHAAAAYATLARGGIWKSPTLIESNVQNEKDLLLDQEAVQVALAGLKDSVTKVYGTGSRLRLGVGNEEPTFNIDGVSLWGKTGTAQAGFPYLLEQDSKPIKGLDHAWFLVMAAPIGVAKPTIVVAVLVEHGGSGGRVAGPIANQILHALKTEGYLEPSK